MAPNSWAEFIKQFHILIEEHFEINGNEKTNFFFHKFENGISYANTKSELFAKSCTISIPLYTLLQENNLFNVPKFYPNINLKEYEIDRIVSKIFDEVSSFELSKINSLRKSLDKYSYQDNGYISLRPKNVSTLRADSESYSSINNTFDIVDGRFKILIHYLMVFSILNNRDRFDMQSECEEELKRMISIGDKSKLIFSNINKIKLFEFIGIIKKKYPWARKIISSFNEKIKFKTFDIRNVFVYLLINVVTVNINSGKEKIIYTHYRLNGNRKPINNADKLKILLTSKMPYFNNSNREYDALIDKIELIEKLFPLTEDYSRALNIFAIVKLNEFDLNNVDITFDRFIEKLDKEIKLSGAFDKSLILLEDIEIFIKNYLQVKSRDKKSWILLNEAGHSFDVGYISFFLYVIDEDEIHYRSKSNREFDSKSLKYSWVTLMQIIYYWSHNNIKNLWLLVMLKLFENLFVRTRLLTRDWTSYKSNLLKFVNKIIDLKIFVLEGFEHNIIDKHKSSIADSKKVITQFNKLVFSHSFAYKDDDPIYVDSSRLRTEEITFRQALISQDFYIPETNLLLIYIQNWDKIIHFDSAIEFKSFQTLKTTEHIIPFKIRNLFLRNIKKRIVCSSEKCKHNDVFKQVSDTIMSSSFWFKHKYFVSSIGNLFATTKLENSKYAAFPSECKLRMYSNDKLESKLSTNDYLVAKVRSNKFLFNFDDIQTRGATIIDHFLSEYLVQDGITFTILINIIKYVFNKYKYKEKYTEIMDGIDKDSEISDYFFSKANGDLDVKNLSYKWKNKTKFDVHNRLDNPILNDLANTLSKPKNSDEWVEIWLANITSRFSFKKLLLLSSSNSTKKYKLVFRGFSKNNKFIDSLKKEFNSFNSNIIFEIDKKAYN